MPIFHDPEEHLLPQLERAPLPGRTLQRNRQRDAEYHRARVDAATGAVSPSGHISSPEPGSKAPFLGRADLIERLKRSNSPVWQQQHSIGPDSEVHPASRPGSRDRPRTPLRSPALEKISRPLTPDAQRDAAFAAAGLEIQRPRSALHSGDFREQNCDAQGAARPVSPPAIATSTVAPWSQPYLADSRSAKPSPPLQGAPSISHQDVRPPMRARAISQSSLASFVFMPPTSPLARQLKRHDEQSRPGSRQASRSPERVNRRHTFSPYSLESCRPIPMGRAASGHHANRHVRREPTHPYQAHQPRRSLASTSPLHSQSIPQTPLLGSRRPSITADASPLHHAPMVGSYEESILRGRMSTTPSRPLDFIAKIGVLGRGTCKPSLRCPPHVTIPFPAVFYSYDGGSSRAADNSPSPYVGLIDLENSLDTPDVDGESRKRMRRSTMGQVEEGTFEFEQHIEQAELQQVHADHLRLKEKKKRRSATDKVPRGGSYRIPQQGQLQIVIKSPSKTAVKLFLVPYDLTDMEAGKKTFIRQRSYSAGPIIDMPLASRQNLGTDRPEASLSSSDDPNERPVLRYLIHLHICCPAKGRYYLYRSIRVVFANRVPDDKEKLRNEIQFPEPRYSAYKPNKEAGSAQVSSTIPTQLPMDKLNRRRSAGLSMSRRAYDQIDGISSARHPPLPPPAVTFTGGPTFASDYSSPMPALEAIPFPLSRGMSLSGQSTTCEAMELDMAPTSPVKTSTSYEKPANTGCLDGRHAHGVTHRFDKLETRYTGHGMGQNAQNMYSTAGLLAQRLRDLDVQHDFSPDELL